MDEENKVDAVENEPSAAWVSGEASAPDRPGEAPASWQVAQPAGQERPQASQPQQAARQPMPPYPWPPSPDGAAYAAQGYVPAYAAAPAADKKEHRWVVPLVFVIIACLTLMVCVASCSNAVTSLSYSGIASTADPTVAVITLDSTIQYDGTANSPEGLKYLLDEAADDPNIKAVVLRVDSGGGTATAGEEMATYVSRFKEETGKPVVVSSASTNASAAYEISSQADYIYTAKSTAIGAIGTAMQLTDYSGLMDMLGINVEDITSSESKDSTYGTRALTEEERAFYQRQVDQINETFIETVAAGRHMTADQVRALANGLTYTGLDAVDNGLADEIGTLEDAMDKAADLAGVGSYYVCDLYLSSSDLSGILSLLGAQSGESSQTTGNLLKEYADAKSVQ